ncbi:hypothetical protein P154DRAFT_472656 [Amniculicola lignicola CBS 123094]|uniref:Spindle pole body component n=1 Tax=Amniculicola lignicola CBS 123094 TaxID=1392246 RepID=A0A6A5W594_9PLEO|nr:hypothetical protein P154DRAFT_472656 [Amniculicola lignicola CBS 123094]
MAQNARLGGLTDELIHSILKFDPEKNKQAYKHAKDLATRGLRAHVHARTNQFEVETSYKGLDEKFRVLDRDDLADALQTRLKELEAKTSKWKPEFLYLLLQLSDRPVDNSDVAALEILRPPPSPEPLTWSQIIADDPLSDEEIWKDIDYAAESSEDEKTPKIKETKAGSLLSSVEDEDLYNAVSCVALVATSSLSQVEDAQFWKESPEEESRKVEFSELQAIRETLFMLAGLETSLYHADKRNGSIRVDQKYIFSHAIPKTTHHLFSQLADIGRDLYRLRQWTKRSSSLPLIQTFEAAVGRRLQDYDRTLASLQCRYLLPTTPTAVSMLELHDEVRRTSMPLLQLSKMVSDIEPMLLVNPFIHLETLYEQIIEAQMTLRKDLFDYGSRLFFESLQTYLNPIRKWMESGELGANDETFFVFESDSGMEMASLWHDRFVLRRGQGNALRSPTFLHPAAQKIFNTGKSIVFLKELGIYGTGLASSEPEPRLDHESVCGTGSEVPLAPFAELFQAAFETWIRSKYSLASTVLRSHLFKEYGLLRILENFQIIHFGANGSVFQDFADAIFERRDSRQRGWNDRFLLTELARGIFATALNPGDVEKLVVRSSRSSTESRSVKTLSSITIDYALPWPIQNIILRSSTPTFHQLFTLNLQIHRAKALLQAIPFRALLSPHQHLTNLAYKLRQRLTWLVDILRSYVTETVIMPATAAMTAAIQKAEDIDEMAGIHLKYLARLQEQSLLSENLRPILRAVVALLDLAVAFADIYSQVGEKLRNIDEQFGKLLPFVIAGLRSVGRVGAEPVWEMLAERLEWDKPSKERY